MTLPPSLKQLELLSLRSAGVVSCTLLPPACSALSALLRGLGCLLSRMQLPGSLIVEARGMVLRPRLVASGNARLRLDDARWQRRFSCAAGQTAMLGPAALAGAACLVSSDA